MTPLARQISLGSRRKEGRPHGLFPLGSRLLRVGLDLPDSPSAMTRLPFQNFDLSQKLRRECRLAPEALIARVASQARVHVTHSGSRARLRPPNCSWLSSSNMCVWPRAPADDKPTSYSKRAAAYQHKPMPTTTAVQFRIRENRPFTGAISRSLGFGGRSTGIALPLAGVGASLEAWLSFHRLDLCLADDALGCT
jgi:hypothetical protein